MRLRLPLADRLLAVLVFAMAIFGVAAVYSAGEVDVTGSVARGIWRRQLVWLAISTVVFLAVLRVDSATLNRFAVPIYILGALLLVATLLLGTGAGTAEGTRRWLRVGPVLIQTPQFANLATILMLATLMGRWRTQPDSLWDLWLPIAIVAVPMVLVLLQPDLGTTVVFGVLLVGTLFWAGTPMSMLLLLASPVIALVLAFEPWLFSVYMVLLLAFVYLYRPSVSEAVTIVGANLFMGTIAVPLWESLAEYQQNRILVFMDPMIDPRGAGYQLIQSRIAIGSGGIFGQGFTLGPQKRLAFLPEQHTDFIFAVIGEELGYVGSVAVVVGFGLILWRLVRLAERAADPFRGILIFGVFSTWAAHIFVNIGMTIGLMPITGIPLPFLSYGGSFLLATFIAHGMAQRAGLEHRPRSASSSTLIAR